MGYQPRGRSPRVSGRGYGMPRHEKSKTRRRKDRSSDSSTLEKNRAATTEEVVDRTVKSLSNLGSQKFGSSPYSEHFSRWLTDLTYVLEEFESSPAIRGDDEYVNERSQILSNIEVKLEERRRKEASVKESFKSLSDDKILLERIEQEYSTGRREIEGRKNSEIKRLNGDIDKFRSELDSNARMKTGLFRGISEKAKKQKEKEITQRLDTAQRELELAMLNFTTERERLRDEFERKKQPIVKRIRDYETDIENVETDGSIEDRRVACEALINAVNSLFQRKTLTVH